MSARIAARLAWSLWALYLLLVALLATLLVYAGVTSGPGFSTNSILLAVLFSVGLLTFATVGALIASRRPENPVGWLMCAFGPLWLSQGIAETYAELASIRPDSMLGGEWMFWLAEWLWIPALVLATIFLPLLFPDGRLPSPRWRIVAWLAVIAAAVWGTAEAFGPRHPEADFDSPVALSGADSVLELFGDFGPLLFVGGIVGAGLSVIVRLTRAQGVERQQLKWFVYAASVTALAMPVSGLPVDTLSAMGWSTVVLMLLVGFPLAIGVAILRYRLYDIDRIINRTLVYGLLTAALGLTYFGLVVGLQALFQPATGGSDVAIVFTTLVVAALFLPARRRIQDTVDRRFNRRRYDAAKTLESFSARLRDEVDMETLRGDLIAVVNETVQPSHVSLWLAAPSRRRAVAEARGVTISGRRAGS